MSITIRKIAADLKLAISTVSKALRDSHEISDETKKRVFEYAEKLNYIPNPYASSLKRRQSGNIAVVIPEVADSFFSIAINGIEAIAQEKGYHVMVYLTHEDQSREKSILREFRSGRVDGVLMSVSDGKQNYKHIHELSTTKIPLVFFDRVCEDIHTMKVLTDDFRAAYHATMHLINKGCQRVAFLSMSENLSIMQQRLKGYYQALHDSNRKIFKHDVINFQNDGVKDTIRIRKLLKRQDRPDGIIASVEKLATLTYTACHALGLVIPKDVKVIGFSSLEIASLLNPSLTTVTQPAYKMGKSAATLLFKSLDGRKLKGEPETIILPSELIERESTR